MFKVVYSVVLSGLVRHVNFRAENHVPEFAAYSESDCAELVVVLHVV
jgi:hypothetical protein